VVTVTFKTKGDHTLMTLLHSDLPKVDLAKAHEEGWNYFLDKLVDHFGSGARRRQKHPKPSDVGAENLKGTTEEHSYLSSR
jgi:hypothetical protein